MELIKSIKIKQKDAFIFFSLDSRVKTRIYLFENTK